MLPAFRDNTMRKPASIVGGLLLSSVPLLCVADDDQARDDSSIYHNREILLGLYSSTGGLDWVNSDNWFQQQTDVCDWTGVTCYDDKATDERKQGHIREIDLSNNHLVGTVPTKVFAIPYLERLIVEDNNDVDVDFSGLDKAQFLTHLDVSNTLVSNIDNIGDAKSLEVLHITGLGLKGALPDSLFDLSNLMAVFANFNSFSGTLPTKLSKLTTLDEIYLYDNEFTGQIPTELGKLTFLEILNLGQNAFQGSLPTELNLMTSLNTIAIQRESGKEKGNGISGAVPAFDNHKQLTQINLENQRLSGDLDQDFLLNCPFGETVEVDLSSNQLTGAISDTLLDKKYLTLYLANNLIKLVSGEIYDIIGGQCPDIGNWMSGDVGDFGCGAFLCPPGTWAPEGRATKDDDCKACSDDDTYWGRTTCDSSTPSDTKEREVLVNFYNVMGGRNWKSDENWISLDVDVCGWEGISCTSDGMVSSIILRNNGLTGTVPKEIFSLTELKILNFQSNSIEFDFKGISSATKLEVLDLSNTDLPAASLNNLGELSSLPGLRFLSLDSNGLDGDVPEALFGLVGLEELKISHNSFTGKLSSKIGDMTNLQHFGCVGNKLTGQIPAEIGQLKGLQDLKAGENQFGGTLPTELQSLTNLQTISLQQVIKSGGIGGPLLSFRNLGQLISLHLDSNRLTGALPSDFLVNSRHLDARIDVGLSDNRIEGSIPSQWSRFDQLFVDLTGNKISGIHASLCEKNNWMDGDVADFKCDAILCPQGKQNDVGRQSDAVSLCEDCPDASGKFFGAKTCSDVEDDSDLDAGEEQGDDDTSQLNILKEFFVRTNGVGWKKNDGWDDSSDFCNGFYGVDCDGSGRIIKIELVENGLKGDVPTSIFNLPQLRELSLSNNDINFDFDGIGNAQRLETLYLDSTNMGSIDGIGDASNLITLHIEDNELSGEIPYELYLVTSLRELDLGYNHFSGKVPNVIGALTGLTSLFMYHNQFTGRLPAALGDLTGLKVLDLAENNFEGTIPQELNDLTDLRFLSIQREGGINGTGDIGINQGGSSVLGGGLTGTLPAFENLKFVTDLYLGVNSLSGSVPYNFLDGIINTNVNIKIDLTSNRLTGTLPASLTQFDDLSLFVAGNQITAIADGLCSKSDWLGGDVGTYSCDGILCPVNTYNTIGRKGSGSTTCETCSTGTNKYLGSFECLSSDDHRESVERAILEKLYKEMNGDTWIDNTNWMDPDENICSWFGIKCVSDDNPSVASIDLENNKLRHAVPGEIFNLPNLQELNLQGNAIVFNFDGIENAQNLDYLDLERTAISSLAGIEKAAGLKLLKLDGNIFEDFPEEIFDLANLEVLSLSENKFPEQELPDKIQGFSKLVYLACSSCGFKGTLPAWIGSLANLEYIRLDQNAFTGNMPAELGSLMNLKHLDLSDQASQGRGLSGNLLDFSSQTHLTELFLQHNFFTGPVPPTLLQAVTNQELVTIDLRQNALTGTVPIDLGRIQDLNLYLSSNLIVEVPDDLCQKPWNSGNTGSHGCDGILCDKGSFNALGRAEGSLECFPCPDGPFADYLGATFCGSAVEHTSLIFLYRNTDGPNWKNDGNWLRTDDHCTWEGIVCHEDGDFKGLVKEIRLGDNNLSGSLLWGQIWQLEGLEYVNMEKNDIEIPFSLIQNAVNLETVILSETKTKSLDFIGGAKSLKSLHITNAALQGSIPEELFQLANVEELYLSHNELSGTLSTWIGQMKKLRDLYLFGNKIQGQLPTELGFLASIQHLSLGENKLSGSIPRQITSLPLLELLSLQKEELSCDGPFCVGGGGLVGTLPALDGLPRISELYLGQNSFTGTIPEHFLQGVNDKSARLTVDLRSNSIAGSIPTSLADFDNLEILLAANLIHDIPDEICNKHDWMNGEVGNSCDSIMCPPGSYNEFGRRVDSTTPCDVCTYPGSAKDYFGSTECGPVHGTDTLDDRSILFELYDATGGSSWTNSAGWDDDDVAFCDWYGVTCEPVGNLGIMTVTEINLSGNNLDGIIPSVLYYLQDLKKLDVASNPVSMGFNAIHRAESLEELYLDETRVSSLLGIGQATSLKTLHLHKNSFGWRSIPDDIFDLTSLTTLNLNDCMFSGTLSPNISSLTKLTSLTVVGNSLSGQIPSEIGMLGSLEELELSANNFFGTLPESLSGLTSLKALFLDNEKIEAAGISGQLHSFATMPSLRELHLSNNQFTGTIPEDFLAGIDDIGSVINVYLDSNHIVGTVPSQLSAFNKLNIDLTDNLITDIGEGLCDQSGWMDGAVGKYQCDAILCPAGKYSPNGRASDQFECEACPGAESSPYMGVSFCLSLQKQKEKDILQMFFEATGGNNWKNNDGWMDDAFDICERYGISCREGSTIESILLGSNHLVGTVPTEIYQLPNLKFLWLYSNPVDFSFAGIAQATSLRSLLLDSTKMRSLEGIGGARSLVDVDVRFNQLAGKIPKEIENLVNLQSFTCSENKFTGTIPELSGLRKLNTLRMTNNMLTGTLPAFPDHPEMNTLDLSENRLAGSIPHNFLETANAEQTFFLDLSENRLTGIVPESFLDLPILLYIFETIRSKVLIRIFVPSKTGMEEMWATSSATGFFVPAVHILPQGVLRVLEQFVRLARKTIFSVVQIARQLKHALAAVLLEFFSSQSLQ